MSQSKKISAVAQLFTKHGKNAMCFGWSKAFDGVCELNKQMVQAEIKKWKKFVKEGKLEVIPTESFNVRIVNVPGEPDAEWFALVWRQMNAQGGDADDPIAKLLGKKAEGTCFWFPSRENRDAIVHFVNGGKKEKPEPEPEPEPEQEEEILLTQGTLGKWGAKQECAVAFPVVVGEEIATATLMDFDERSARRWEGLVSWINRTGNARDGIWDVLALLGAFDEL